MSNRYEQSLVLIGLKSGLSFELLCEYYDLEYDSLESYLNDQKQISFKHLSPEVQLEFIVERQNLNSEILQSIKKYLVYPLLLVVIATILTVIYEKVFIPNIIGMLSDFGYQAGFSIQLGSIMYRAVVFVYLVIFTLIVLCSSKTTRFLMFIRLNNFKLISIVKLWMTLRFAFCFDFLLKHGRSTQSILNNMRNMTGFEEVRWLSFHVHKKLDEGIPLEEAIDLSFFDTLFVHLFKQGYLNDTLESGISEYVSFSKQQFEIKIRRWAQMLKVLCYGYIMIYIGLFYSLLFKPLQMLEGII